MRKVFMLDSNKTSIQNFEYYENFFTKEVCEYTGFSLVWINSLKTLNCVAFCANYNYNKIVSFYGMYKSEILQTDEIVYQRLGEI